MTAPRRFLLAACVLALAPASAAEAQSWRLRLDARAQMAAFRGVELDSLLASEVVTGPTGGPVSPDGIIARCPPTTQFCYVFRPGERRRGGPAFTSADLNMWGLGVRGLRVHLNARAGVDLGSADAWPGTDPAVQLIEGYAEYAADRITGRAGRQLLANRLGWTGFDGARVIGRLPRYGLDVELYGGLGLGQATALTASSPALNPLDDFQPRSRQILFGAGLGWRGPGADIRFDYQREVDRDSRHFWSERVALSGATRMTSRMMVSAAAEYDLSNSWFGTSELDVRYTARRWSLGTGARHYRPYFPLWTIWGAFSPVPYRAVHGRLQIAPVSGLGVNLSTEYFRFLEAETETPLVQVDQDGWRSEVSASYALTARLRLGAGYRLEYGPGASVDGFEANVTWRPREALTLQAYGATLTRPLEFRLNQSEVVVLGFDAAWQVQPRLRVAVGAAHYDENRERPDAAGIEWKQLRLNARASWQLASDPDIAPLPPAIRRRPEGAQ
ncbi:MAG: hypothetical protein ACM357_04830 [Gemmatimonadota bacterium]